MTVAAVLDDGQTMAVARSIVLTTMRSNTVDGRSCSELATVGGC